VVENSKTVSHCGNKGARGFPLGNGKQDGERPNKEENDREREGWKNDMTWDCVMYSKQKQSEWKELDIYRRKRGAEE
jgi:hypothetical protein